MKLKINTDVCARHSCNNKRTTKEGGRGDKVCENEKTHKDFTDHTDQELSVRALREQKYYIHSGEFGRKGTSSVNTREAWE